MLSTVMFLQLPTIYHAGNKVIYIKKQICFLLLNYKNTGYMISKSANSDGIKNQSLVPSKEPKTIC